MAAIIELLGQRIPEKYLQFLEKFSLPTSIALIAVLVLSALFGYKLFKIELAVTGAITFGMAGFYYVAPVIVKLFGDAIPWWLNVYLVTAIVLGIAGAILAFFIKKFAVFTGGASVGFSLGWALTLFLGGRNPDSVFLNAVWGRLIIGAAVGVGIGILYLLLFKPMYIITTSVGGLVAVGYLIPAAVMSVDSTPVIISSMAAGCLLGIPAAIYQFKSNGKSAF